MPAGTKYTFIESNIHLAPVSQGVYILYDGDQVTYYGSSEVSIHERLLRHHGGYEGQCTKASTHFAWETTARPLAREADLLESFKRIYGRLPRCNERVG